jgi:methyl-accepting chemotaxis protein
MASTAEELSSQAEQLQASIGFFKLDATIRKPAATPKSNASRAVAKAPVVTKKSTGENGNRPPARETGAGRTIVLAGTNGTNGDAHDREFENY